MTKTIKLSLAAALLATSVSAVEFSTSGKMEVEYDYSDTKVGTATSTTNGYDLDIDATVKGKFSDNWTAVAGFEADNTDADASENDAQLTREQVEVTKTYAQYTQGGTTALIGRQGVGTPFFDDETANGVVALQNFGGVTVAAAHFNNLKGSVADVQKNTVNAQAVIGAAGSINYSLWLAQVTNVADAFSANVSTKVGPVSVDVRHSEADYEKDAINTAAASTAELTEVALSTEINGITLGLAYGETNNQNATQAGVDLTGDADAATNFGLDTVDIDGYNDAEATVISASTKLAGATVTLAHLDGDAKVGTTTVDAKETKISFAYPLAKGATLTGKYTTTEATAASSVTFLGQTGTQIDIDKASLAVEFKF